MVSFIIQNVLRYHGSRVLWNRCSSRKRVSVMGWRWMCHGGRHSGCSRGGLVGWRGLRGGGVGEERNRGGGLYMGGGFHAGALSGSDGEDGVSCDEVVEEEVVLPETCPGCGVKIQIEDPDAPGYVFVGWCVVVVLWRLMGGCCDWDVGIVVCHRELWIF